MVSFISGSMFLGTNAIVQLGLSYVLDQDEDTPIEKLNALESALTSYLSGAKSLSQTTHVFNQTIGTSKPFNQIVSIVQTPDSPIPDFSVLAPSPTANRRLTRSWTEYENQRLLAGIYRFGTDDWAAVAAFVGNGRTRSQCSQRWLRGLNPSICKERWSPEDEATLLRLVEAHGTKCWTKIAAEMGNRSDVQCRYHYNQLNRGSADIDPPSRSILGSISLPTALLLNPRNGEEKKVVLPPIGDLLSSMRVWAGSASLNALPRIQPRCTP
jgi:hypothetical protein